MSSIDPSARVPLGPDDLGVAKPEAAKDQAAARAGHDGAAGAEASAPAGTVSRGGPAGAAWQARLAAVNRGPGEPTALERHTTFFDENRDDMLTIGEVRRGLERLGMDSWVERVFASTLNNALLAPPTRDRLLSFKIDLENIHKARHAGDTGIYDEAGHFDAARFEGMFERFDTDGDGRLTATEIKAMVAINTAAIPSRSRGRFSAEAEFDLLLKLCAYEDDGGERYVTKDLMLRFYDGTLFDEIAAEVKAFGGAVRRPVHDDSAFGDSGPLPAIALRGAGPVAGAAAGAAFGASLLASDAQPAAGATTAVLGGMMAVCPYMGALPGGSQPG